MNLDQWRQKLGEQAKGEQAKGEQQVASQSAAFDAEIAAAHPGALQVLNRTRNLWLTTSDG